MGELFFAGISLFLMPQEWNVKITEKHNKLLLAIETVRKRELKTDLWLGLNFIFFMDLPKVKRCRKNIKNVRNSELIMKFKVKRYFIFIW